MGRTIGVLAFILLMAASCGGTAGADLAEKVRAFDDYPIVWLGESYDADGDGDLDPITTARSEKSAAFSDPLTGKLIKPELRWFTIAYGTCDIPVGASACPVPLQLSFSAPCENRGVPDVGRDGTITLLGVEATVNTNGDLRFETADFTLTISAVGSTDAEQRAEAVRAAGGLVPANARAKGLLADGNLRPRPASLCTPNAE